MKPERRRIAPALDTCPVPFASRRYAWTRIGAVVAVALGAWTHGFADEDLNIKQKLNLSDLPRYRAALDGKSVAENASASLAPVAVRFRDLWIQPTRFLGRRVIIHGRVERVFRQPAVGSFPPLAEVWIASPAGDPFCTVFALAEPSSEQAEKSGATLGHSGPHPLRRASSLRLAPDIGQSVEFTGTFLKMVSYAASDGKRVAPLVVGDQPPRHEAAVAQTDGAPSARQHAAKVFRTIGGNDAEAPYDRWTSLGASWPIALVLGTLAAGVIASLHLRTMVRSRRSLGRHREPPPQDNLPLEFIN
jgi:hypothetical protein